MLAILVGSGPVAHADGARYDGPLFEGHIHYNRNSWDAVTPEAAVERLRAAGIRHAFVSSTPTEGTERLFAADAALVVPLLRPYRSPADRRDWFADPTLLARLEQGLASFPYRGIGEFHVFGEDASTPVMRAMLELAAARGLFVHAHADEQAIVRIARSAPGLTVVWAHAGFDVRVARLAELLDAHPRLMIELSYRSDVAPLGQLAGDWRELFVTWPDRFILGADTHVAGRWGELGGLVDEMRQWLAQLPPEVAQRIAFGNAAEIARPAGSNGTGAAAYRAAPLAQSLPLPLSLSLSRRAALPTMSCHSFMFCSPSFIQ